MIKNHTSTIVSEIESSMTTTKESELTMSLFQSNVKIVFRSKITK